MTFNTMSKATKCKSVCIRVDPEIHDRLQEISKQEGLTITTLIYRAMYKEYGLDHAQRGLCLSNGQMDQEDEQGAVEHAHDPFLS